MKEDQRIEIEMLEKIVDISEFEELPEVLLHNESHRMVHELEDSVARQGLAFEDYLKSIKKTHDDLEKDFAPQAEKRVKTSIIAREIYQEQKIEVTEDEVNLEVEEMMKSYPGNDEARKQLEAETYKDYLRNVIGNRKVIEYLKKKIVKE
jgi:trigger factor